MPRSRRHADSTRATNRRRRQTTRKSPNRRSHWLPVGIAAVGLGAALATGAGVAAADDGASAGSDSAKSAPSSPAKAAKVSAGPAKPKVDASAKDAPRGTKATNRKHTKPAAGASDVTSAPDAKNAADDGPSPTVSRKKARLASDAAAGATPATEATAIPDVATTAQVGLDTATPSATPAIATAATANPVQDFFGDVALFVRRTFFNQAPTINPVQITGQHEGPITGTVGAVDPEDDPLSYAVTKAPEFGTVAIGADGTYTYTPGDGFTGADAFTVSATDTGFHLNLLDLFRPTSTAAVANVSQHAIGAPLLTFTFTYGNGAEYWSAEARDALERVAKDFATNFVVSAPRNLTFVVYGQNLPNGPTLAEAGSPIYGLDDFNQTVVQHKVLTGEDLNSASTDGQITVNFGYDWSYEGLAAEDEFDFETVATHELMHAFGFTSTVDPVSGASYTYACGQFCTTYDSFIVTDTGAHPILFDTGALGGVWNSAYDTNLTGGNGGLYFSGANAVAAYGGLVPLYTPAGWNGSSVSHLDGDTFVGDDAQLMNPSTAPGIELQLSAIELGILKDLGYSVTEPLSLRV
jgi:hypothetical protein